MSHDSAQSSPTSIRLAAVAVLTAFGLLASACSSSGTAGTGSTASAAAPSTPPVTSASAPAAGSSSSAVTSAAGSSVAPSSNSASSNSGSGGGSFCAVARNEQAQSQKEAGAYSSGDPASLEKLETDGANELKVFVAIAPSAIKSDAEVIAATDLKLFNALKAAKFVIQNVDQKVLTSLNTPAFMAAAQHITAYLATTCGITASSTP